MKKFIRALKVAFNLRRSIVDAEINWLPEDMSRVSQFLSTETGRKLITIYKQLEINMHDSAVHSSKDRDYVCGKAAGCSETLGKIVFLGGEASIPQKEEPVEDPYANFI